MTRPAPTEAARQILAGLQAAADPGRARQMMRYFRTGKGEYGAGDRFLGLPVPVQRGFAKQHVREAGRDDVLTLLSSAFHEGRLTGVFLLVQLFSRAHRQGEGREWVDLYLSETHRINNWDLVDSSAYQILGRWLSDRERKVLYRLAASESLWENRIAMVATLAFIRQGEVKETLALAEVLRSHPHDLIHKATGWMLREAWLRAPGPVEAFLERHRSSLPRTLLRYTIEKMPEARRKAFLRRQ